MSKELNKKTLVGAMGAVVVTSLAASVQAADTQTNPFAVSELSRGYQQLAEGACGEGKCGSATEKDGEGKCGEGKCGEGKCGSDSSDDS